MRLVGDRKMWVLAAGEAVTGVAFARGRDVLEAHVGSTGAVTIGEVAGDCCGKAARPAAVVVVGVGVVVAAIVVTGAGSQISEKRPEAQPRVW